MSPKEVCESLIRPRKIILLVKAGAPVDNTIESLLPYLDVVRILQCYL